jgi:ribulose-5-phosphate 4-epimerase/fuculose-1-phosphate aldolase
MKEGNLFMAEQLQPDGAIRDASEVIHELVAANRILFQQNIVDAYGHVSARHPKDPHTFLISSGKAPALVTPEHIVQVDFDGRAVRAASQSLYLERFIHAEIYRARPDVWAVVHSHSPSVLPFSLVPSVPLRPICHMSGFLFPSAPVFEIRESAGDSSDLLISSPTLGRALVETLGTQSVVLMRGHGSTVVGRNLREAVFQAIYTEINARLQREALSLGSPTFLTAGESAACTATVSANMERAWNLWLDQL